MYKLEERVTRFVLRTLRFTEWQTMDTVNGSTPAWVWLKDQAEDWNKIPGHSANVYCIGVKVPKRGLIIKGQYRKLVNKYSLQEDIVNNQLFRDNWKSFNTDTNNEMYHVED